MDKFSWSEQIVHQLIQALRRVLEGRPAQDAAGAAFEEWARSLCEKSREVHVRVWAIRPPNRPVEDLIETLDKCVDWIPDTERLSRYKLNIRIRSNSLRNYLAGRPPVFPSDAIEKVPELKAEWERQSSYAKQHPPACAAPLPMSPTESRDG